ncbi:FixH family protein [Sphingobacterium sp. SGL-16]|uniref:FixH family protein n=1 Tax=Sphingobacterium sp. SGL-16 TaxID=2710883 RepID=UPI0013EA2894|nr:FixH family protein [Sphingobacterium sp. SGL-16]NGM72534.1 FixH family protein [Sphingobacterium sp. SGL-16]
MKPFYFGKSSMLLSIMAMALIYSLTGCGNSTHNQQQEGAVDTADALVDITALTKIADTTLTDKKISVLVQDSLTSKNETIYIQITDLEGNPVTNTNLDYNVIMDMGMMSHGGPYYPLVDLGDGIYKAEAVFIMANMKDMGKGWILNAVLNKTDSLSFLLPVSEAKFARTIPVGTKEDGRVFVSLLLPNEVKTGSQTIDFTLHKMDQEAFPPLDNYTVEIEPFMPDMGHGSPDNKAAVSKGNGRYSGTVNFTMKGPWTIKVNLFKKGEKVSQEELVFPVEVK